MTERTIKYYDENAKEWAKTHGGFENKTFWNDEINIFKNLVPGRRVLEIGSGTGKEASFLIDAGFIFHGSDASGAMVTLASERNPGVSFRKVRAQDVALAYNKNEFDGVWSVATLLHIPKREMKETLKGISAVLKDGGVALITLKKGEGEKEDEGGRHFSYYTADEFSTLAKRDFGILEKYEKEGYGDTWLVFFLEKPKKT